MVCHSVYKPQTRLKDERRRGGLKRTANDLERTQTALRRPDDRPSWTLALPLDERDPVFGSEPLLPPFHRYLCAFQCRRTLTGFHICVPRLPGLDPYTV